MGVLKGVMRGRTLGMESMRSLYEGRGSECAVWGREGRRESGGVKKGDII